MASGVGLPIVDYQIATQNQTQLLAQFQKTSSYTSAVSYYQANIGKVKTPDDLLKDPKLLQVALSAFQLENAANETGILRALLTQDPTQKGSLAQQLIDPRFRAFAQAFSSLRNDNGATINNPVSINAVLAGYTTNEYDKFVSNTFNDPSLRQALFFQNTIEDTIDISDAAKLFGQFQQSQGIQQAVAAYKDGIASVTSVSDLLNNPLVLHVALQAFNIDPSTVSTATLQRILTEPATAPLLSPNAPSQATDPLLTSDSRFQQFAATFSSLNSDGGATARSASSINTIITNYQSNQFAQTVAADNPTTLLTTLGSGSSDTISTLLGDFQSHSGITTSITAYQNGIGGISSVSGLVNNPQLLTVALGAFNIDPNAVSPALVTQLLTNDPNGSATLQAQASTLLRDDPNVAHFVKTFGVLGSNPGADFTNINSLFQQFQQLAPVQTAITAYQSGIGSVKSVSDLVNNSKLLNVALTAFNIDPATASTSKITNLLTETPSQQASDPLVLADPRYAALVKAFGSLNTDHGAAINAPAAISSIVTAYQKNLFAQTLATNDPNKDNPDFSDGSTTINKLLANFTAGSGVNSDVQFYETNIASITTVPGLVDNPHLLKIALGAFGIDANSISTDVVSQLLTPDSTAPANIQAEATALLQNNPNVQNFVNAFKSLNTDDGKQANTPASITKITSGYIANQFQQSIAARTQEVLANPSLATSTALPLSDARSISTITSAFQANQFAQSIVSQVQESTATPSSTRVSSLQLIGNATLQAVTFGALGLPAQTGALDPTQQQQALQRAHFDPSKLTDPTFLKTFIQQFLANAGQQSGATGTSAADVALAALTNGEGGDGGPIPLDLSALAIDTGSSGASGGSTDPNAPLVNLFA